MYKVSVSSGGLHVLQFEDETFAHLFYTKYNNWHDDHGRGLMIWTLENDRYKAIANKVPELLHLKCADNSIDVGEFELAVEGDKFDKAALCN